jgi:glucose-1-phosphate adenylyltransferase
MAQARKKILALVMAGGEGTRLFPLTSERSKPSVPFGARYRIVDFVLSNLLNSGVNSIYLLVQYKSQSLIEHVRKAWVLPPILPEHFVTVVPPQMRSGKDWFQGTADAVYQNINLIEQHRPDMVLVFGADHIYRMNIRQMIQFHLESQADATVAALPVPLKEASAFGVIDAEASGRIRGFQEKPASPPAMPGRPTHAFASMGNYLFNTEVLLAELKASRERGWNDFGKHILPSMVESGKLFAYDFGQNSIPGVKDYEEPNYWRDVGTLDAYYEAHMDVLGEEPRFDVFNARWPIYSSNYQGPVAKFVDSHVDNCIISAGCLLCNANVKNSVLRREVVIEPGAEVDGCILMDNVVVKRGAKLRRCIVDRFNVIEENARIGFDADVDRTRYAITETGITVIGEGKFRDSDRSSFSEDH